jgi:hypothetical protein
VPDASEAPIPTILLTVDSQLLAVLPVTVYPPDLKTVVFTVRPWHPVHDEVTLAFVTVDDVQDCDKAGVPPVQPVGDDVAIVLVCVPFVQVLHPEYVNEVQVGAT